MKIVFLDIEGVLNTKQFLKGGNDFQVCDPKNVRNFNKLIKKFDDVKVVISSSWRIGRSFDELITILRDNDINGEIIDTTPEMSGKVGATRSGEIQAWLNNHDIDNFVILDDGNISLSLADHHVKTSFNKDGLTEDHIKQATSILQGEENNG
jgi:hypothetical protein